LKLGSVTFVYVNFIYFVRDINNLNNIIALAVPRTSGGSFQNYVVLQLEKQQRRK